MERDYFRRNESVTSRVAWGPIFAGAFVAFVCMMILNTFGLAVGLTGQDGVGTGFAIWAVIVALVSLYAGGYVMSYVETNSVREFAMIQAIVLWGMLTFGLVALAFSGLQLGVTALIGTTSAVVGQVSPGDIGALAGQLGISEQELRELQTQATAALPGAPSAWWSLVGMLASLGAVIAGAVSGAHYPSSRTGSGASDETSTFQDRTVHRSDRTSA